MSDDEWEVIGVGPALSGGDDEWEVIGVGPKASGMARIPEKYRTNTGWENFGGGALNLLNALTLGYGDEITAGGSALLDALSGDGIGQAYDDRLNQARGLREAYREDNPYMAIGSDIVGGAMLPAGKLVSAAKGFIPKVAAAGAEGAGFGAAYGFGEGEGFEDRLGGAKDTAQTGAMLSAALGAPFAAIESLSPRLTKAGQAMKRKSLGPTQSDYTRTADQIGAISEAGEVGTKTKKALDFILTDPLVKNTTDPVELLSITRARQTELAKQVRGLVEGVDESKGVNIQPSYSRAAKYIEKSVPADKVDSYESMLANFKEAVESKGKGRLGYLQDQKIALGKLWDPNDTTKNGYIRELYGDIQNAIEQYAPEVKGLNDELSNWMLVEKMFERQIAKSESRTLPETMRGLMKTTGGFGVPFLAGMYSGNPVIGTLAGALGAYATSPGGQRNFGRGLELLSHTSVPTQVSPLVAALLSGSQPSTHQLPESIDKFLPTRGTQLEQALSGSVAPGSLSMPTDNSLLNQQGSQPPKTYPNNRQSPSPTQGESSDMYNPVKYNKKEVPFEDVAQAVGNWETRGLKDKDSAISPKGAGGYMQVMPATAKEVLAELGEDPNSWNPKDREMNKRVGSYYLNKMLDQFGDLKLALAAYNAGPGAVRQWIKRFGSRDWDVLSKRLKEKSSYLETVNYVPGVLKNLSDVIEV